MIHEKVDGGKRGTLHYDLLGTKAHYDQHFIPDLQLIMTYTSPGSAGDILPRPTGDTSLLLTHQGRLMMT